MRWICKLFYNKGDIVNVKIIENIENLLYGDNGVKISYGIKKWNKYYIKDIIVIDM